jgi:hypothetical protein
MSRMDVLASAVFTVLAIAAMPIRPEAGADPSPEEAALRAYRRFQDLAGVWRGESTRGWDEEVSFRVIAGGSAVVETSFGAHPGETMLTLFSLNRGELELTHYCVAKNQPHLRATEFAEGGRQVTFTFVDAGNLRSRDEGHMDRPFSGSRTPTTSPPAGRGIRADRSAGWSRSA